MPSLGNDLAYIRKERELSLDDIYEATKIPMHILESIEDDSIFSDFEKNATYIRSYVRSYAKVLAIDEDLIIRSLDKKQAGKYSGELQQLLEDQDVVEEVPKPKDDTDTGPEEEVPPSPRDAPPLQESDEKEHPKEPTSSSTTPPKATQEVYSVDWADMGRRFQPLESTKSKVWVSIIIITIMVATGTYLYFNTFSDEENPAAGQQNPAEKTVDSKVATDSLQLDIVPPAQNDTMAGISNEDSLLSTDQELTSLPDTLTLVIYAAYGKLEPVRVYSDISDSINPYWIEQTQAFRFDFVNELRIRGQYSRMELIFNGHPISNFREQFYNPDTRLLEIERSFFEGDSIWLQPAPDSLEIDAPPPSVIKDRPTFN